MADAMKNWALCVAFWVSLGLLMFQATGGTSSACASSKTVTQALLEKLWQAK